MLLLYKLFRKAIITIYTTKKKTSHEKKRKYLLPKVFLIKTINFIQNKEAASFCVD